MPSHPRHGPKTLDVIRKKAKEENYSLWKASCDLIKNDGLTSRARGSLSRFMQDLENQKKLEARYGEQFTIDQSEVRAKGDL